MPLGPILWRVPTPRVHHRSAQEGATQAWCTQMGVCLEVSTAGVGCHGPAGVRTRTLQGGVAASGMEAATKCSA